MVVIGFILIRTIVEIRIIATTSQGREGSIIPNDFLNLLPKSLMIRHRKGRFDIKWICRDKNAVESQRRVTEITTCQTQILNVAIREKAEYIIAQFIKSLK